jgi:hypothetical protein
MSDDESQSVNKLLLEAIQGLSSAVAQQTETLARVLEVQTRSAERFEEAQAETRTWFQRHFGDQSDGLKRGNGGEKPPVGADSISSTASISATSNRSYLEEQHFHYMQFVAKDKPEVADEGFTHERQKLSGEKVRAMLQIFVKNPVTGERADFSQFMETLKTAASLNGCSAIMSDDEEIWQATVKGDSAGALMEIKTMLGLITALGLKGPEASAVADVKSTNCMDVRGMIIGIMGAHNSATNLMTERQAHDELDDLEWEGGNYDEFWQEFQAKCNAFNRLKDDDGNSLKLVPKEKINKYIVKFKRFEKSRPVKDRPCTQMFDNLNFTMDQTGGKLTLEVLHRRMRALVGGFGDEPDNHRGRSNAQKGDGDTNGGACPVCNNRGHTMRQCKAKNTSRDQRGICWNWQRGGCKFEGTCQFKHPPASKGVGGQGGNGGKGGKGDTQVSSSDSDESDMEIEYQKLKARRKTKKMKGKMAMEMAEYQSTRNEVMGGTGVSYSATGMGIYQPNQSNGMEGGPAYYDKWSQ